MELRKCFIIRAKREFAETASGPISQKVVVKDPLFLGDYQQLGDMGKIRLLGLRDVAATLQGKRVVIFVVISAV